MPHFSHPCMYMAARAYANEMLMRRNLSLIIFVKLHSHFKCAFKKSFLV